MREALHTVAREKSCAILNFARFNSLACIVACSWEKSRSLSLTGLGSRQPPRLSCLVKYDNLLLPTNAVKFHIVIGPLCLLCHPHGGFALPGK